MPILISVRGAAGGASSAVSPETWSFGTWWSGTNDFTSDPTPAQLDSLSNDVMLAVRTYWAGGKFQSNVFADQVRCYYYKPSNLSEAFSIGYSDVYGAQGTEGPAQPLESSIAVSLYTEGRTKPRYGRFYLPPQNIPSLTDGLISEALAEALLARTITFLTSIDTAVGALGIGDAELVVQSRKFVAGDYPRKPVRLVRVGRVVDTQRRRRRQLEEAYEDAVYPPA